MPEQCYTVLFLCTANSARSIMAESILKKVGENKFESFSAGSQPAGKVNPIAVELLKRFEFPYKDLRSKSWNEFAGHNAAKLDFVFTICDRAAAEVCPIWPGQPMTAHWGIADPAVDTDDEVQAMQRFRRAFAELERRITIFVNLPFEALDSLRLQQALDEIGQPVAPTSAN